MITARAFHSMVTFDNHVVCIGGNDEGKLQILSSVEAFDLTKNEWKQLSNMHQARRDHSSIVFKGFIYTTGGFDGQHYMSSVERYDWLHDTWTVLPPLFEPKSLFGIQVNTNEDGLILCGGFNGSKLNSIEEYYDDHKQNLHRNDKKLIEKKFDMVCIRKFH
jgi:hypothetical protein